MNPELTQLVLTEAYQDVKEVIQQAVFYFARKYGGDYEELLGEANLLFVEAYQRHKEDKANFKVWVKYFITKQLLERLRTKLYKKARCKQVFKDLANIKAPQPDFNLSDFIDELPADAAEVVKLIFYSPPDIDLSVQQRGGYTPHRFKLALMEYLSDLGWGVEQILSVFTSIKEALK